MTCPACSANLVAGMDRCPSCGAIVSPALEGSLAPDPRAATPPARGTMAPLRELPGMRKKEKSWKDEVKERVRHRKLQRAGDDELPLFREAEAGAEPGRPETAEPIGEPVRPEPAAVSVASDPHASTERVPGIAVDAEPVDLPLRPAEQAIPDHEREPALDGGPAREPEPPGAAAVTPAREMTLDDEPSPEWPAEPSLRKAPSRPPERPARAGERALAAALDLALLVGLWAVVVYFASRAGRVSLAGLLPAWPYLLGFLALLGLTYAVYFTGTTGQTLGKMVGGLRVVDTAGRPPGFPRACVRAVLGVLGIALAFAGLATIFFDPARRALHDRIVRTRVIKS